MGFNQYHEPAEELSQETRTMARILASMKEEIEAIDLYDQRISVEQDPEAKNIMRQAQKEEFLHFSMDLEFVLRRKPILRKVLKTILFTEDDLVELAEKAESELGN